MTEKVYDIVIVGAGAAGMTAAIYGVRAGKEVLVFEAKTYGGQIINTTKIENYPAAAHISGVEFANNLYKQAEELGAEFRFEEVLEIIENNQGRGKFKVLTDEGEYVARAIILANGSVERRLGLSNEEKFVGRGISYCATCDGGFFKGKTVAVNGGGNTALWDALYLANLAAKVYVIHRRGEFRADKALVEKVAKLGNVEFLMNKKIVELAGGKKLEKIILEETEVSGGDSERKELAVGGLFVAIGREPDNQRFKELIELDKEGYIESDESCRTSREGVFCAGDVRKKKLNQLVTATADGAVAATGAIDFISRGEL